MVSIAANPCVSARSELAAKQADEDYSTVAESLRAGPI